MQRRKLLAVGAFASVLLAMGGATVGLLRPARVDGRLGAGSSEVMAAVAGTVLDGFLPSEPAARSVQIQAHLSRLQTTISGFPPAMQAEVDEMLALLAHPAGRLALAGLHSGWSQASPEELRATMRSLQTSSLTLRQQVFHALRDLTNAAYFAEPATWSHGGYPGPLAV